MFSDADGYDLEPPEEILPWLEAQRKKQEEAFNGFNCHYILINGKIKQATFQEWMRWFEDIDQRRVDYTEFKDGSCASTVCLGLDHNFDFDSMMEHRPILFESMVFGGKLDQFQWRYSTYGEAKQGHREIIAAVRDDRMPDMGVGEQGFWMWFKEMFDDFDDDETD